MPAILLSVKRKQEGKAMKMLSVRVPERIIDRLKFRALKEHTSVQTLVNKAIEELLKQRREEDE